MKILDLTDIEENIKSKNISYLSRVGNIYCSSKISDQKQLEEIKELKIGLVIDLKEDHETDFKDEWEFKNIGIEYHHFPISSFDKFDFQTLCDFSTMIENTEKNILIYCISSNRVGALMSLYLAFKCGHPKKRSFDIGRKLGMTKDLLQDKITTILNKNL